METAIEVVGGILAVGAALFATAFIFAVVFGLMGTIACFLFDW